MRSNSSPWPELQLSSVEQPMPTDYERIEHMLEAIDRLGRVFTRFTLAELLTEDLPQSGACRCYCVLGAAAAAISPAFKQMHTQVNWQRWKNFSRYLVREYYRVNYKLLWQRWQQEIPALREQLHQLKIAAKSDASV